MTNLNSVPDIGKASLELLEATGFSNAESLAKAGVDELTKVLERANGILQVAKCAPARAEVEKWIFSARSITGISVNGPVETSMPKNYEQSPAVSEMLGNAPFAIPLPAKLLVDHKLGVGDIPAAILLNRYSGDLEVRVDDWVAVAKTTRSPVTSGNIRIADNSSTRVEIDTSRIKPIDVLAGNSPRPITRKEARDDDRVALIRGPRMETNQGRDPRSRLYIRGVLHSHPHSIAVGAAITLILGSMLPTGIISAVMLLLSSELPQRFSWVPKWLLIFPLLLPMLGIAYLIWSVRGSCRICGQKLFVPRMCLKNTKAHHIRGLGHIIPLCFHILLFKWFRCTYCGTPVRLKQ